MSSHPPFTLRVVPRAPTRRDEWEKLFLYLDEPEDHGFLAEVNRHRGPTTEDGAINARRLAACWNYCLGMNTLDLERQRRSNKDLLGAESVRTVKGGVTLDAILAYLGHSDCWFEVMPRGDDLFDIRVRSDRADLLRHFDEIEDLRDRLVNPDEMHPFTICGVNPDFTRFVEWVSASSPEQAINALFEPGDRPQDETTVAGVFAGHITDLIA
jgi:hypothetical protein